MNTEEVSELQVNSVVLSSNRKIYFLKELPIGQQNKRELTAGLCFGISANRLLYSSQKYHGI